MRNICPSHSETKANVVVVVVEDVTVISVHYNTKLPVSLCD